MNRRFIVFDAMGVIFMDGDDTSTLLVPYVQSIRPQARAKTIHDAYLQASLGALSPRGFWERVGCAQDYPQVERAYLDSRLRMDPDFWGTAARLRPQYGLALLSNDVGDWSRRLRRAHGLDGLLDCAVVSGDVGCRKPDGRIFHILLERLNAPARRCLLVDDRVRNLEAAAALGLRTLLFARRAQDTAGWTGASIEHFSQLPQAAERLLGPA